MQTMYSSKDITIKLYIVVNSTLYEVTPQFIKFNTPKSHPLKHKELSCFHCVIPVTFSNWTSVYIINTGQ